MEKVKIISIFILSTLILFTIIFSLMLDSEIKENIRLGVEFIKDPNRTWTDVEVKN